MVVRFSAFLLMLLAASPAVAASGTQVPEASSLTLFALGVVGVLVGRHLSSHASKRDAED